MLFRSTRRAPPWSPRRGFFTSGGFEWMHCAGWQSDLFFPRAMSAMPPPPPFILRLLGSDDVELMEEMLTVFGEAFAEAGTFNDARPSPAYLARLLGSGRVFALAAPTAGPGVGGLAAYEPGRT